MGNSKQKIIEKLNCIPDDLSEEGDYRTAISNDAS